MLSVPVTYRYPFVSGLLGTERPSLDAATCARGLAHPFLFDGEVHHPAVFAASLSLLSKIVRTHFFLQLPPNYLDPVVTISSDMLRLEGFSACCGVYARADLPIAAFDGQVHGNGTTNVDFGTPMQLALARITAHEPLRFRVGRDNVELQTAEQSIVERKVDLPVRWVKSFTEVSPLQRRLRDRWKVGRKAASQFFKSLPKGKSPKQTMYAVPIGGGGGGGVRLSTRGSNDGVGFCGVHRVRVLESLVPHCDFLRGWSDNDSGVSGWELQTAAGRFFLMLSPQPYRGFSGEGQNLRSLTDATWDISTSGFDVTQQLDFDRELPIDLTGITKLQPRLKNARKLLDAGKLKMAKTIDDQQIDVLVPGTSSEDGTTVEHYIRLRTEGDVCSCRWHSRYQGRRGPCKHILAARMFLDQRNEKDAPC